MGIAEDYSDQVREHMGAIPVWQPGDNLKPGAIGRFRDGVFYQEGFITNIWPDAPTSTLAESGQKERYFISDEAKLVGAEAQAKISNLPASVQAKVEFSSKGASIFHATDITVNQLDRLHDLLLYMNEHKYDWPKKIAVISHVESASSFALLCSRSKNWEVTLTGDASPVKALKIADGSISISSSNGAGYQSKGSGPVMLRAYGVRGLLGKRIELLESGKELEQIDSRKLVVREIDALEI